MTLQIHTWLVADELLIYRSSFFKNSLTNQFPGLKSPFRAPFVLLANLTIAIPSPTCLAFSFLARVALSYFCSWHSAWLPGTAGTASWFMWRSKIQRCGVPVRRALRPPTKKVDGLGVSFASWTRVRVTGPAYHKKKQLWLPNVCVPCRFDQVSASKEGPKFKTKGYNPCGKL